VEGRPEQVGNKAGPRSETPACLTIRVQILVVTLMGVGPRATGGEMIKSSLPPESIEGALEKIVQVSRDVMAIFFALRGKRYKNKGNPA